MTEAEDCFRSWPSEPYTGQPIAKADDGCQHPALDADHIHEGDVIDTQAPRGPRVYRQIGTLLDRIDATLAAYPHDPSCHTWAHPEHGETLCDCWRADLTAITEPGEGSQAKVADAWNWGGVDTTPPRYGMTPLGPQEPE